MLYPVTSLRTDVFVLGSHTNARVNDWSGKDSVGPSPTESHISTLPLGRTAWKMGTTAVSIFALQTPPTPGSAAAAVERLALGTFWLLEWPPGATPVVSLILAALARVCLSIWVIGVPTKSCWACSRSLCSSSGAAAARSTPNPKLSAKLSSEPIAPMRHCLRVIFTPRNTRQTRQAQYQPHCDARLTSALTDSETRSFGS